MASDLNSNPTIAILGGGIAGLSAAIALRQQGFEKIRIYERNRARATSGGGIVLWPNATYVLDQIGLLPIVSEKSGRPVKMRRLSSSGDELGMLDLTIVNRHLGSPTCSILRADLLAILFQKAGQSKIPIHDRHIVEEIRNSAPGRAQVRFQNGQLASPDIVIGADGRMSSHSREYVLGKMAPVFQNFVNWVGVCDSHKIAFQQDEILDCWGIGERFGLVPLGPNKAYWAAASAVSTPGPNSQVEDSTELVSVFGDWPSPIDSVIRLTPSRLIRKIYVHDHDPSSQWHRDNLVMIGDAAHAPLPTSGQGACQALEDAWFLAHFLAATPSDLAGAFTRFTKLRSDKTIAIVNSGRSLAATLFNRDPVACKRRNQASKKTDFAELAQSISNAWRITSP